jgi:hypothetical protein
MKWKVEVSGEIEVEAETEREAIQCAIERINDDIDGCLCFDAEEDDG